MMEAEQIYYKIKSIAGEYHTHADQLVAIAKWFEYKLRDNNKSGYKDTEIVLNDFYNYVMDSHDGVMSHDQIRLFIHKDCQHPLVEQYNDRDGNTFCGLCFEEVS